MAGIMLRSLSNPRTPLPFIGDPLAVSANIGCPAWSHPGPEERSTSGNHTSGGGGKTKHAPESHRASPYPPLARSSSGYGSAAGLKRLAAVTARSQSQTSSQSLRRTASLQGGDTLAALQESCRNTSAPLSLSPPPHHPRRNTRTGSTTSRALRPAPTLVNLDLLVCPPPAPPPRSDIRLDFPTAPPPAPTPPPARAFVSQPPQPLRRRSSLAPAETSPAAMITRAGGSIALPSPPLALIGKKKRESLAQRTLRRTFERTPRGAQVKVLGAHAAVRMMTAMNENEEEEEDDEAAVAASVVVVVDEDECMADADAWVELNEAPISPISNSSLIPELPIRESPSPVLVEAPLSSHIITAQPDDMEWSMIDEDECRAG